jgi:hypothetical protein
LAFSLGAQATGALWKCRACGNTLYIFACVEHNRSRVDYVTKDTLPVPTLEWIGKKAVLRYAEHSQTSRNDVCATRPETC